MYPIAVSLSPNTERDDVILAWRVLLSPWLWRRDHHTAAAEQQLSRLLNSTPALLTSSGRSAIYTLLRAAGIGQDDEVIIQAFTCLAVPAAIQWTGARPVYADITTATFNLDPLDVARKITPRTKAIIVQHTFGLPGPLVELQPLAAQHRLMLIEDCAHALGARLNGQPVGTLSNAAVFSFGRDKSFSCVFGGAIASRNISLLTLRQEQQQELPPSRSWTIQQLLHPILLNIILPLYFTAHIGPALLVLFQKMKLLSKAVEPDEKRGAMPAHVHFRSSPALALLLKQQLSKLDRYTARRRAIAERYRTALAGHVQLPHPLPDTAPSWLRFPLLVEDPAVLLQHARRSQLLLGDWYHLPIAPHCNLTDFHYQLGSCPQAEFAAAHVINLPTYPRMTDKQVDHVIDWVKNNARPPSR